MSLELNLENGLSVVIPTFNEANHIKSSVDRAVTSLEKSNIPYQVVIVDDGSTDLSIQILSFLKDYENVDVILKAHTGRIQTRLEGIKHCKFENVLMLDARVQLDDVSIANLKRLCAENPNSIFWNGHVEMANLNLPHVSVWQTLVGLGWSAYVKNPRLCSFGLNEFDSYPKGTGIFLASRSDWQQELAKLADAQNVSTTALSDDTRLLREFASKSDIWLSPEFKAIYFPRTEFRAFVKNLVYRGTTFIDSYWDSKNIVGKGVKFAIPVALLILISSLLLIPFNYWVLSVSGLLVVLSALLGVASFRLWKSFSRASREFFIGFVFWPFFGFGLVRGFVGHIANG